MPRASVTKTVPAPHPVSSLTLPVENIEEDPGNARLTFDPAALKSLADSIAAQGLLQPPVVRLLPSGKYRLVDGHRRFRAAKLAGLAKVRCELVELDDQAAALAAATANLQREDLTPYEQARAFKAALDAGMTKKELGERAGVVFNTIKARLELLELPEAIGQRLDRDGWTIQHAQAFFGLKDHPELIEAALADKELSQDVQRGNAYNMGHLIASALGRAGKARSLGSGFSSWEHPGLEAKLRKLGPTVKVGRHGNYELVLDVKAYDELVAKSVEAKIAKDAAARAKHAASPEGQAEKGQKAREKRQREIDALADKEANRLALAGMVATLSNDKHVADAVFSLLRSLESNDGLIHIAGYGTDDGLASACWKAAGAAAGADVDAIGAWLSKDGDMGKGTPAWFTKLKPNRQLAFVTGLLATNEIYGYPSNDLVKAATGKSSKEWTEKGRKEAKRTFDALDAASKDKKPKSPPAAAAAKKAAKPAAKAKGKAKASKPVKETPAVQKARAKLAQANARPKASKKGKQAALPTEDDPRKAAMEMAVSELLVDVDPLPAELPAAEPEAQTS